MLLAGLRAALDNLRAAGVRWVYLDGSFVTDKESPNDIDGCWEAEPTVEITVLDPVFLDFSRGRAAMKSRYGVDFFVAGQMEAGSGRPFREFFQTGRDGRPKGIIRLDLSAEGESNP
jgi:hypothetical protein